MAARDCHLIERGRGFRGRPSTFPCVGGPAACRAVLHVVVVGEDHAERTTAASHSLVSHDSEMITVFRASRCAPDAAHMLSVMDWSQIL